jgi:two-component system nitrogen regulation response regulator NtrX
MRLRKSTILIIDDEPEILRTVSGLLEDEGYRTATAPGGRDGLARLAEGDISLILMDIYMPGMDGLETLGRIRELAPRLPVIMISGQATIDAAVKATKLGAADFVEKPLAPERLLLSIRNTLELESLRSQNVRLTGEIKRRQAMLGESAPMRKLREEITRTAPSKARVLILGENGSGKELVAAAIHDLSPRRDKPFVKLNCAAIPKDLIESELFGHEKGAFTGALARKEGRFDLADGGTLLLDEIGDMSLDTQAKLLRVLEESEFERLGGKASIRVDVRVVASTNKDLAAEIKKGTFREDLYFRISTVPIRVPPLRERREDIPLLARHFIEVFCEDNNRPSRQLGDGAIALLVGYDWPGNVRELKNVVEHLVIMTDEKVITEESIRPLTSRLPGASGTAGAPGASGASAAKSLSGMVEDFEQAMIAAELDRSGWNVSQAAARLGIDRANLHRKMRRYGMTREGGKDTGAGPNSDSDSIPDDSHEIG